MESSGRYLGRLHHGGEEGGVELVGVAFVPAALPFVPVAKPSPEMPVKLSTLPDCFVRGRYSGNSCVRPCMHRRGGGVQVLLVVGQRPQVIH